MIVVFPSFQAPEGSRVAWPSGGHPGGPPILSRDPRIVQRIGNFQACRWTVVVPVDGRSGGRTLGLDWETEYEYETVPGRPKK